MKKGDARRHHILDHIADYLLAHGLQDASLRPLAAAAGTSDRMLMHYFVDKDTLLAAALAVITQRFTATLAQIHAAPMPFHTFVPHLSILMSDAQIQPYLRLWLELVTFAAKEQEPFRAVAQQIATTYVHWIADALDVETEAQRQPLAALALAIIEGLMIFDALGDDAKRELALAGMTFR